MSFSFRQINKIIKKIDVTRNSVILIKKDSELAEDEVFSLFREALRSAGLEGVVVLTVDSLDELDELDLRDMRKAGWVRLRDLSGLRRTPLPNK